MRTKLAWFIGLLSAVNGVFMMMAPAAWYPIFPGVVQSGPFNGHFIRDIGAAFLVAGVGFVWFANDSRARPAALAAAAFLLFTPWYMSAMRSRAAKASITRFSTLRPCTCPR